MKTRSFLFASVFCFATTGIGQAATQYFSYTATHNSWNGNYWAAASGGAYTGGWGGYNEAILEGTGGTVSGGNAVNKWTFNADGYVLSGGFTMGSPGFANLIVPNAAHTATISGNLSRANTSNILWKDGLGKVILSGTNSPYQQYNEQATLEISGGATTVEHQFHIGRGGTLGTATTKLGTFLISGGNLTVTGSGAGGGFFMGQYQNGTAQMAQFTQTGGTVAINGGFVGIANGGGVSQLDLSGGSFTSATTMYLGVRGSSTLNISGTAQVTMPSVSLLYSDGVTGSGKTATINLNGGSLAVNGITRGATLSTSIVNFNGGTLKARTTSAGFMSGLTAANVNTGGAKINTNNFDITISQALLHDSGLGITPDGGLTKSNTGTLTLTGTNTYTGNTTINAGTLAIGGSGAISASPVIDVATNATLQGGSFGNGQTVRGTGTLAGNITLGAGASLSPAGDVATGTMEVTGTLNLGGAVHMQFQKSGGVLSGDQITGTGSVSCGGTIVVTASGETLALGDSIQLFANTGGFSNSFTSVSLPSLPEGLTWNYGSLATTGTITVSNALSAPLFSLAGGGYLGSQSVTLTADSGSTIYYTTDGSEPTETSASGSSPLTGLIVPVDATTTIKTFARKFGTSDSPVATATYVTLGSAQWNVDDNGLWSEAPKWLSQIIPDGPAAVVDFYSFAQSASTDITLDSNRTVGAITFGNSTPIDWLLNATGGSSLTLAAAATPELTVNESINATISAPIAGSQGLSKLGTGVLTLSGANTYTGNTTVHAGTLKLGASNILPDAFPVHIAAGAFLDLNGKADAISFLLGNGRVTNNGGLTIDLGGAIARTFSGTIDASASTFTIRGANGGTGTQILNLANPSTVSALTLNGTGAAALELAGGNLAVTGSLKMENTTANSLLTISGGSLAVAGADFLIGHGGGNSEIHQTGGSFSHTGSFIGIANFGGTSTLNLSGGTFTTAAGIALGVRGNASLNLSGNATVETPNVRCFWADGTTPAGKTATINLDGGSLTTGQIFRASTQSTSIVNFNGGTLRARSNSAGFISVTTANVKSGGAVIDTDNFNLTIGQALLEDPVSTGGGLTKTSAGTLTLAASNTYTGPSTINEGSLFVTGSTHASSQLSVAANATLGGTGNAAGTVTAAGTIAPGTTGTGTFATGTATLTGTYACQLDGATADRWNVSGDLDLTGATLAVSEINPATFTSAVITTYTGTLTGTFTISPELPSGITVEYDTTAKEIRLVNANDFDSWLAGFTFAEGDDTSPAGDPDGDGLTNQQEHAFGLDPTSGASVNPITSSLDKASATFTYTRRKPSLTNLTYRIWTSPDLVIWTEDTDAVQTPTDDGDNQSVLVTLSAPAPLAAPALFVRCTAE